MTKEEAKSYLIHYLSDFANKNRLLLREEFSDFQREMALNLAVSLYNNLPPLSNYDFEQLDKDTQFLIIKLACAELLEIGASYYVRNTLQTSTDVSVVDFEDKMPNYVSLANQLRTQIINLLAERKMYIYYNSRWYILHSPYYTPA